MITTEICSMGVDVMENISFPLVFSCVLYLFLAVMFLYASFKMERYGRKLMIFCSLLMFAAPVLLFLGMILQSDRLTTAGTVFPLSLLAFLLFASNLLRYRRCGESVRAKRTDCRVSSSRGWERCTPCFTYE